MNATRVAGSFRDPTGFVFRAGDRIYRSIDPAFAELWSTLEGTGVAAGLQRDGLLVETALLSEDSPEHAEARSAFPESRRFLRHAGIDVLNFPYEWSAGMLADAGVLCLDLQIRLSESGFTLKDASAFNVQFRGTRPVFIDVTSIEKPRRRDLWLALGQFQRMYLFPLLLRRYRRMGHKGCFLANLDGISLEQTRDILGAARWMRPSLWLDVSIPGLLTRWADSSQDRMKQSLLREGGDPAPLLMNLRRLRSKLVHLGKTARASAWTGYTNEHAYPAQAESEKEAFVDAFLEKVRPKSVLDLGCNTGRYSIMAARKGIPVVAIDSDHDCVDSLYRAARASTPGLLPLWADIAQPSPAMGFAGVERESLLDRVRGEAVLALALVHHLLVTSRVPLRDIRDLLWRLTGRWAVVEFVHPSDPLFQKLLGLRENIYQHLTVEHFLAVFGERFRLVDRKDLTDTQRHVMVFEK